MKTKYIDLIEQTYDFPQEEFQLEDNKLQFHGIDLYGLAQKYGTPLKFTYLPKISDNIQRAKGWFNSAIKKHKYAGKYHYCYCTKSSHFEHVLNEALKNDIHIETSSAFDINIVEHLKKTGKITKDNYVICNGFKRDQYIQNIARLINNGHKKCIPIITEYYSSISQDLNLFNAFNEILKKNDNLTKEQIKYLENEIRDLNLETFNKKTFVELFDSFDNKKYVSDEYIVRLDNKIFEISKLDGNLYLLDKIYNKLRVHHQIDFQTNLININIYEDDQILLSTFLKLNYCFPYYQIDFRGSSVKGITRDSVNLELSKFMKKVDDEENKNSLICPMPGKLIELFVKVGDKIEIGQNLCIVEAMKMENTLVSSLKGQVKKINFKVNDLLKVDDIIIEF